MGQVRELQRHANHERKRRLVEHDARPRADDAGAAHRRRLAVTTALSSGDLTFVTDEYGDVRSDVPEHGLFVQDVRVLERFELLIGGKRPELLEHSGESALGETRHLLRADTPGGALLLVRSSRVLPSEVELWIRLESASADVVASSLTLRLGPASPLTTRAHAGSAHEHAVLLSVDGFTTMMRFSAPPAIGADHVSYPFKLAPDCRWTLGVRITVTCPP